MVIALEPQRLRSDPAGPLTLVELAGSGEASALACCNNRSLLDAHGFDVAFWTVTDEDRVEKSLWVLGHSAKRKLADGWRALHVRAPRVPEKTIDTEALAEHRGIVYALGSCFGRRKGPLSSKRAFLARFREQDVGSPSDAPRVRVEVAREPFRLHRLLNDGLRESGLELMPLGPHARRAYIERTLGRIASRGRASTDGVDVRVDDWPLNIEGMTFVADDVVLLGLRYPVTTEGSPIIAFVDGRPGFFSEPGAAQALRGAVVLSGVGTRGRPVGVRAITRLGSDLHVITGPIAARERGGALAWDHPSTIDAPVEHWSLPASWLSVSNDGTPRPRVFSVEPRRIRSFDPELSVEGLSPLQDGRWCYVIDQRARIGLAIA